MKQLASCTVNQLHDFMRLADMYGWEKTWESLRGYLRTEHLRRKWVEDSRRCGLSETL